MDFAALLLQAVVREDCDGGVKSGQSSTHGTDSTAPVEPVSKDSEGGIKSGQSSPRGTDSTAPLVGTPPSQEPEVRGPCCQITFWMNLLHFELHYW